MRSSKLWNTQGVSLALYLAPHWYQTWLFLDAAFFDVPLGP
jgi:hypothetical protein